MQSQQSGGQPERSLHMTQPDNRDEVVIRVVVSRKELVENKDLSQLSSLLVARFLVALITARNQSQN